MDLVGLLLVQGVFIDVSILISSLLTLSTFRLNLVLFDEFLSFQILVLEGVSFSLRVHYFYLQLIQLRLEVYALPLNLSYLIGKLSILYPKFLALDILSLLPKCFDLFLYVFPALHHHSFIYFNFLVQLIYLLPHLSYQDLVRVCVHYWFVFDVSCSSCILQGV